MDSCSRCSACCRNVSVEVDEADTEEELDEYIWILLHENICIYIDDDNWYVEFKTPCKSLAEDGSCKIYDRRPKMCRTYDPDTCLKHGDEDYFDHMFETPEQLRQYWNNRDNG